LGATEFFVEKMTIRIWKIPIFDFFKSFYLIRIP
jgi:hypothetical protein